MCLTIPKKVITVDKDFIETQTAQGEKEKLGTLLDVKKGDWVLSLNSVIIKKLSQKEAKEILKILK